MRFDQKDLSAIWVAMQSAPFRAGRDLSDAVEAVVKFGNGKHEDDDVSVHSHLRHAQQHMQLAETEKMDREDGYSHRAHTAARLVLALIKLCKGSET